MISRKANIAALAEQWAEVEIVTSADLAVCVCVCFEAWVSLLLAGLSAVLAAPCRPGGACWWRCCQRVCPGSAASVRWTTERFVCF